MRISDWSSDVCSSDLIALDIGSSSAALDSRIREGSHLWIDWQSDDVFYSVKGQMYAYDLLLRELRQDFSNVIRDRELGGDWDQMMSSFSEAASLQDRKSVVWGKSVSVRVELGGRLSIKKKKINNK